MLRLEELPESDMEQPELLKSWRRENGKTRIVNILLRPHLLDKKKEMDKFMGQTQKTRLYVSGPPGCGKTTFFLAYFTQWARKQNQVGLIIQFRESSTCEIVLLRGQQNPQFIMSDRLKTRTLEDLMEDIINDNKDSAGESSPFDFCVFDGVQQQVDVCKQIMSAITVRFQERKVINITSLEFDIKGGDGTSGIDGVDQFMRIDSWTLSDYLMGYERGLLSDEKWVSLLETEDDKDFIEDDDDKQTSCDEEGLAETGAQMELDDEDRPAGREKQIMALIERKFVYAGGSARFFFDHTLIDLVGSVLPNLEQRVLRR